MECGKFDHHQKNRNGKRKNGIYYSSIGLLWKAFGKEYLEKIGQKNNSQLLKYIDEELIQNIDAADNMQLELVENKILPDFIKLCNPEWNENISIDEAFLKAVALADIFWELYIKHAIAEVNAINIILKKIEKSKNCYVYFDKEMPYRKVKKYINNSNVKYIIFKSRRKCYDVRIIIDNYVFKDELVTANDITLAKNISKIQDLIYVDVKGKLCCTKTLNSALELINYNEGK